VADMVAPPISIVLPPTYNDLNLEVGLPKSYVTLAEGSICPLVILPVTATFANVKLLVLSISLPGILVIAILYLLFSIVHQVIKKI
jgi:hypothetical protein